MASLFLGKSQKLHDSFKFTLLRTSYQAPSPKDSTRAFNTWALWRHFRPKLQNLLHNCNLFSKQDRKPFSKLNGGDFSVNFHHIAVSVSPLLGCVGLRPSDPGKQQAWGHSFRLLTSGIPHKTTKRRAAGFPQHEQQGSHMIFEMSCKRHTSPSTVQHISAVNHADDLAHS